MTKSNAWIAIVDDEEPIRRALSRLMRSAGLPVQGFASGAEFLESLQIRQPDCVVLDLHMPGMTGFDVQARLQHDWPGMPVIVVTGHHSPETQARALHARPVAYLHKPMNDQSILDAIALALNSRVTQPN